MSAMRLDSPSLSKRDDANSSATASLPPEIQSTVPWCAASCLLGYIDQEYSCQPPDSLSCLCSQYSSDGYTLGEFAYGCLRMSCSDAPTDVQVSLYNICSSEPIAAVPTHSTVTLPSYTIATAPAQSTPSGVVAITSASSNNQLSSATSSSRPSTSASSSSVTTSGPSAAAVAAAAGQTTTPGPSPSVSPAAHSTDLTAAQATGISIGAMGVIVLAIGLIFLIAYLRRRRIRQHEVKPKHGSYDFIDDAPRYSPFRHGSADPRGPLGGFAKPRVELANEKSLPAWYGHGPVPFPGGLEPPMRDKGRLYSPDTHSSFTPQSRRSNGSMRTVSQLLPEKPGVLPPPQQPPRPPQPQSKKSLTPASPATVFEEDPLSPELGGRMSHGLPPAPLRIVHRGKPTGPQFASNQIDPPKAMRHPPISLEIPSVAPRGGRIPSPVAFPPPPTSKDDGMFAANERTSTGSRVKSTQSSQPPGSANSYIPNYYTSQDSRSPDVDSPTPIDDDEQKRKTVPASIKVTKPSHPPLAVRSLSEGSDTSFESNEPEEPTPPVMDNRSLSPVAESPVSGIRYPKVPRPSNQAVSRLSKPGLSPRRLPDEVSRSTTPDRSIPPTRSHTPRALETDGTRASAHSGSTLAAKRRGGGVAHDLEQGLHIQDSALSRNASRSASPDLHRHEHRHSRDPQSAPRRQSNELESPLKGYGRAVGRRRPPSYAGNAYGPLSPDWRSSPAGGRTAETPRIRGQEVVLKSPLWEPKLTPSRKGDDLYLNVSVGSPCATPRGVGWPLPR